MVINYDTLQISLRSDYVSPFDLKKPFLYFLSNIYMHLRYGVKLTILKLGDLFIYECTKLVHVIKNGRFKKVLIVCSHYTRQANAIQIPRLSTAKCQRSFMYRNKNLE